MVSPLLAVGEGERVKRLNDIIVASVRCRINQISLEHLRHFVQGKPSELACRMIQGILTGMEPDIVQSTKDLCLICHTSGTDIAIGVILGFSVLLKKILTRRRVR